ncbi:hypothetical protein M0811_04512 [Anaeramoeba ignava]|uniref:Uncharacterized protein n=1 Tax=Anaeramoeba ignava TaxID=1746090 RepID=A0A9Q0RG58_ANAIG|nr:hypothetical protein M0811_04512 [Anaeramoeba ignava]
MGSSSAFISTFLLSIIAICAVIIPCLIVSYPDKDKDCDKKLWTWILVGNIIFAIANIFSSLMFCFSGENGLFLSGLLQILFMIFILIWGSIGLSWARSSGIEEQCGKLYNVTFGESIFLLFFLVFIVLEFVFSLFGLLMQ